jgi:PLP dependent protein
MPSSIRERLSRIRERVHSAAVRSGRNPDEIELVAVSKYQPVEAVAEAIDAGLRHFGESRFQETPAKISSIRDQFPELEGDIRWAFIGALQSNKVKPVLEWFSSVQSVGSGKLLTRVDRIAGELGVEPEVLLQVNISDADSQSGVPLSQLPALVEAGTKCEHVRIKGLMAIGPNTTEPLVVRRAFARLRKTAKEIESLNLPGISMNILSMGMTGDFEIAVEEGSTLIRIGTALFGPRST